MTQDLELMVRIMTIVFWALSIGVIVFVVIKINNEAAKEKIDEIKNMDQEISNKVDNIDLKQLVDSI